MTLLPCEFFVSTLKLFAYERYLYLTCEIMTGNLMILFHIYSVLHFGFIPN